jgi:TatD DNase family protein
VENPLQLRVPLFDAHNHLQDAWLEPQRSRVLADCIASGVTAAVVNGTSEADWADVATLAAAHAWLRPSFGLHPWHVGSASPQWRERLLEAFAAEPHAAVGEIGLDRWILDRARPDDPRLAGLRRAPLEEQLQAFLWQLDLAARGNIPVTIHCLDAWGPLRDALRNMRLPARGFLLHAYGGSAELAREFADRGAFFSFNGAFLAPRSAAKRAVFAELPAERLLVETDAPAMPLPPDYETHHLPLLPDGTRVNHPANLRATHAALAELRGVRLELLAKQIAENFTRFFGP